MTLLGRVCAQVLGRLPVCPAEAARVVPGVVISPDATQNQKLLHLTQQNPPPNECARAAPSASPPVRLPPDDETSTPNPPDVMSELRGFLSSK